MGLFDLFKKVKKGPLIIAIHGFGKRRTDEYIPLKEYFKDKYDMVFPELFDQRYPEDNIWYNWVSRAESEIIKAKKEKRESASLFGISIIPVQEHLPGKYRRRHRIRCRFQDRLLICRHPQRSH